MGLAGATYDGVEGAVGEDTTPQGLFIKPDGTQLYTSGTGSDLVRQYDFGTPWDLTTLSFDASAPALPFLEPTALFFKPDGTKMYVALNPTLTTNDGVYQFSLSTPWDVTSASYDSVRRTTPTGPTGLFFKTDGTKMFVVANNVVNAYSLSGAWDLSTATADGVTFSPTSQDSTPEGVWFDDDGAKMYVVGSATDSVYEYDLSTPWLVSSAAYNSVSLSVTTESTVPRDLHMTATKLYVLSQTPGDEVLQYSLVRVGGWSVGTVRWAA